jgi:hypothetical protein
MQITVTITEKEVNFLKHMIKQESSIENKVLTHEDVIHECIRIAMFDENEAYAQEEGVM